MVNTRFDVAIIGAGMIGASVAYHVSKYRKVILIEQEPQAGYHSSGRSAAVLVPSYGSAVTQALTAASVDFLSNPPADFSETPLISPRGTLFIASAGEMSLLNRWHPSVHFPAPSRVISGHEAAQLVPILKPDLIEGALFLPTAQDIDAAALLLGYLKECKARGGTVLLSSEVERVEQHGEGWTLVLKSAACAATHHVQAKTVVNAAGAWADQAAALAGLAGRGLVPSRRTMAVIRPPADIDVRHWPLVADAGDTFYFKPDAGRLAVSPADATPMAAHDVQADEWDVAVAVDRFERATTLSVGRVEHRWAGLRTISREPDQAPIIGFDAQAPNFLWAAGFGGFGIQTAHAAGQCCMALICGEPLPVGILKREPLAPASNA